VKIIFLQFHIKIDKSVRILCVAATKFELEPLIRRFRSLELFHNQGKIFTIDDFEIHFLVTGIGPVFTTYNLTKALIKNEFDFVLNLGIGGSYVVSAEPGVVLCVREEIFADIGVEANGYVKTLFESGLMDENEFPFREGKLVNPLDTFIPPIMKELTKVKGLTVNRASGKRETADFLYNKFKAEVETMEGAAVFYTCLKEKVRFSEIRAISNFVGDRNKANWEIDKAVNNLTDIVFEILIQFKNGED
jgi:futalosine hydrolase